MFFGSVGTMLALLWSIAKWMFKTVCFLMGDKNETLEKDERLRESRPRPGEWVTIMPDEDLTECEREILIKLFRRKNETE